MQSKSKKIKVIKWVVLWTVLAIVLAPIVAYLSGFVFTLIGLGFDRSLYREPQSVVQWREEMKEQKKEVLRDTKVH